MKTVVALGLSEFGKTTLRKKTLLTISWIVLIAYVNLAIGCSYFNVNVLEPLSQESITEHIKKKNKYIILHQGEKVWHLKDIAVLDKEQKLNAILEPLPSNHFYYRTAKDPYKANRYKTKGVKLADRPIHEIHIYSSLQNVNPNSQISIPFSTITKVEVYDTHVGATVFSTLGIVAVVGGVVALIIVATKSSCPFVYISDGSTYHFMGEMFGGAIYAPLERDDYMPLSGLQTTNGAYQIRISNELLERQYTNLANLMVIEHPLNTDVILDKQGNVQTIQSPQLPIQAMSESNIDLVNYIRTKDSSAYLFNEVTEDKQEVSSLMLTFKKEKDVKTGKLILRAKNSFWLDYAYGRFNEQFGVYFNAFTEKQKKVSSGKHYQWSLNQNIPLAVYVETENGWKFVDYFNSIGPLASRDIVMPIDFADIKGDRVNVKLECGYMFWEVDYAAMDFSSNTAVETHVIKATSAIDEKGTDVSSMIEANDNRYLVQPDIGNVATISYKAPTKTSKKQTVFLHSRGYYEYIRDYKNLPNVSKLKSFKNKGAFTKFAKEQYHEFMKTEDLFAAALTQENGN